MKTRPLSLLAALCALVIAAGCGGGVGNDGGLVGGSCDESAQCSDRCVRGGEFPGGTCTVGCDDDLDCPGGTACIDREGGICLLLCDFDSDCRDRYDCGRESRRGHSGGASVCIDD